MTGKPAPKPDPNSGPAKLRRRAVAYLRMSTELQQYSTDNQIAAIEKYAAENDMELVATYSDEARSGLRYENRPGMQKMLADAQSADAGFDTILVYDISRWGRFQDQDEAAALEFECRKAKVQVHYCMDQFVQRRQPDAVARDLKEAVKNHSQLIDRADRATEQLEILVEGLRLLMSQDHFRAVLRGEMLQTMPAPLARLVDAPEEA